MKQVNSTFKCNTHRTKIHKNFDTLFLNDELERLSPRYSFFFIPKTTITFTLPRKSPSIETIK